MTYSQINPTKVGGFFRNSEREKIGDFSGD